MKSRVQNIRDAIETYLSSYKTLCFQFEGMQATVVTLALHLLLPLHFLRLPLLHLHLRLRLRLVRLGAAVGSQCDFESLRAVHHRPVSRRGVSVVGSEGTGEEL